MRPEEKILQELIDHIEGSINTFGKRMPGVQEDVFNTVLDLTGDLETSNGRIKPSVKNIKIISKIKAELNKVIFNNEYDAELEKLIKSYDEITKLQNQYFSTIVGRFTVPTVLKEVQNLAIEGLVDAMGREAISANFVSPIRDILVKNVTTGGSKKEFIQQARDYILGTKDVDGKLVKYTGQIVTDALNQYSANYSQIISDDLGFEWFAYVGSNKKTTRDFCKAMTEPCIEYFHISQFDEIVKGQVCGKQVPIYEKTDLPYGMIPGTNAANFRINRGGYNCNHQVSPVSSVLVPKELRAKFE